MVDTCLNPARAVSHLRLVAHKLAAPTQENAARLETLDTHERTRKVLVLLTQQLEILKMSDPMKSVRGGSPPDTPER